MEIFRLNISYISNIANIYGDSLWIVFFGLTALGAEAGSLPSRNWPSIRMDRKRRVRPSPAGRCQYPNFQIPNWKSNE